jgi:hypothetical protein
MYHLLAAAPPSATSVPKGLLGALIVFAVLMLVGKILGSLLRTSKS